MTLNSQNPKSLSGQRGGGGVVETWHPLGWLYQNPSQINLTSTGSDGTKESSRHKNSSAGLLMLTWSIHNCQKLISAFVIMLNVFSFKQKVKQTQFESKCEETDWIKH